MTSVKFLADENGTGAQKADAADNLCADAAITDCNAGIQVVHVQRKFVV